MNIENDGSELNARTATSFAQNMEVNLKNEQYKCKYSKHKMSSHQHKFINLSANLNRVFLRKQEITKRTYTILEKFTSIQNNGTRDQKNEYKVVLPLLAV